MTYNQKAQARIFFENKILKADGQAFEDLFTQIMNYKELDFQSIKPWGDIGDRKNDGYIKSRGIFYQVYAPQDIKKSYPKVIDKIKTDFKGLTEQWSNVREFYFVINDKYKGVNADSEQLLQQIKEDNNLIECKFITAKDLENILFDLSDDQIIKVTGVSFHDSTVLTSAFLRNTYLKKFDTISLLINDTLKPIENIFINLAIIKEKKENKQDKNLISREAQLNSYEEIYKPKEPIEIKELINKAKKSLVYGKAGVGKTTLCKYIAYKWAKGELYSEFEYVVYLPLREWKTGGILQAIKNYYFPFDSDDLSFELKGANRLFLFDGYDELSGERKKDLRDEIEKYGLSHYIITTRPYGYQRNDFRVDEHFETIGFVDEDVEAYIDNFFEDSEPKKRLKAFLDSNIGIKHIAYIPLMLEMICSLWQEQPFSDSLTMTELYSAVVESILKKHSAKKEDEAVYKRANRKKINSILGKLAFRGLTKQTILFDGDFIEEVIDDEDIEFFEKSVINSGFLKSDRQEKDLLDNNFEFLHLTFQEYFSALYVASLSKEEQSEIIRDWKFYPHMQVFFAFLGGLIEDKEFLLEEIESEPMDLIGVSEFYLNVICIHEIKKEKLKPTSIVKINKKFSHLINLMILNNFYLSTSQFVTKISHIFSDYNVDNLFSLLIFDEKNKNLYGNITFDIIEALNSLDKLKVVKKINTYLSYIEQNKNKEKYIFFIKLIPMILEEKEKKKKESLGKDTYGFYLKRYENLSNDEFISFIKDDKIEDFVKEDIIREFNRWDDRFIFLIKDKNISFDVRWNLIFLVKFIESNHHFIIIQLLEILEDDALAKELDWQIIKMLGLIGNEDKRVLYKFNDFIQDKTICNDTKTDIVEAFATMGHYNDNVFQTIAHFINHRYYEASYPITLFDFILIFKLYDNSVDIIHFMCRTAFEEKYPLYLKNNKLHTIENGKEISTQREVDEATLNKIIILLKGDNLND